MRCDLCPLSDPEDTCPEAEGKFGIEHKDGMLGCKHPRNWKSWVLGIWRKKKWRKTHEQYA